MALFTWKNLAANENQESESRVFLLRVTKSQNYLEVYFSICNRREVFDFSWPLWQVARVVTSVEFVSKEYRQNYIKCARFALNLKENNRKVQLNQSSMNLL